MIWISFIFGMLGFTFGVACYLNTRKWARLCQRSRIVIAYNRRVQLNATLLEFIDWITSLDDGARGREIYRVHKMSVSIVKADPLDAAKTKTKTVPDNSQKKVAA